jgi:hypothetical protein
VDDTFRTVPPGRQGIVYGATPDFAQLVRRDGVEGSPAMTMPTVIAPKDAGEADPVAGG